MLKKEIENYLKQIDNRLPEETVRTYLYKGKILKVYEGVWDPYKGKSTKMFLDVIRELRVEQEYKALEIGCGCGILSLEMWYKGVKEIVASDISLNACRNAKHNFEYHQAPIHVINADLFPPVKEKFHIILFNAPAIHPLRVDERYSHALWSNDLDLLKKFMNDVENYLLPESAAYLMYARFIDFDPLPLEEYVKKFNIYFAKTYKGKYSEGGVLKIRKATS